MIYDFTLMIHDGPFSIARHKKAWKDTKIPTHSFGPAFGGYIANGKAGLNSVGSYGIAEKRCLDLMF
jgi:hypothetical protein